MQTELEFLRELEQDVQMLRRNIDAAREDRGFVVVSATLATSLKVKLNHHIVDLLGKQAEAHESLAKEDR
jgi:hypothetical protein